MERIGEKLRKRREELGFTIDDIARATNFRPELIRAVEGGRTTALSADAYLKAFLRAYATKLDLDPNEIILEQKSEEERIQDALSEMRLGSRKALLIPRWLVLSLIIAAAALGVFLVYQILLKDSLLQGAGERAVEDRPATGVAIGDTSASDAVVTAVPGESGEPVGVTDGAKEDVAGDVRPGASEQDAGQVRETVDPGGRDAPEEQTRETGTARLERDAEASREEALAVPPASQNPDSLMVSVSGWSTHVRLLSGEKVLLDGRLSPGYSETFYSAAPFLFDHITNKDAVSLLFNGRPVRLADTSGSRLISNLRIPPEGR